MDETTQQLEALPEGTVRLDKRGIERTKGRYGLWYRTVDVNKPDSVGITSFEMTPATAQDEPWTAGDIIAQFDAHPYQPPQDAAVRVVRLEANLAPTVADALKSTSDQQGVTITEALRRAIAVYKLIHDAKAEGNTVWVKTGTGEKALFREVLTTWERPLE